MSPLLTPGTKKKCLRMWMGIAGILLAIQGCATPGQMVQKSESGVYKSRATLYAGRKSQKKSRDDLYNHRGFSLGSYQSWFGYPRQSFHLRI